MRSRLLALSLAMLGLMSAGCVTHRVRLPDPRRSAAEELAQADRQVLAGCYTCLLEARDTYIRLHAGPLAGQAAARRFEVEILIALRDKELAVDADAAMARASAAAAAVPGTLDTGRILRLAGAVPPAREGISSESWSAFARAHVADMAGADVDLAWLTDAPIWAPVRDYLTLSVRCSETYRTRVANPGQGPPDDPPLLMYRRATCGGVRDRVVLEGLQQAYPWFPEVDYFLGRAALGRQQSEGTRKALAFVGEAYAHFPQSPAVTYLTGAVSQASGDCREALRHYDETLVSQPRHENAQLGRTICLTYLNRPDEAIAAATELIGWRSPDQRDAFYWRAFNHHLQHRLDQARADIELAKRLGVSVEIETLAGIIEYEQDDLASAKPDLDRAWDMSGSHNCVAPWYLGLVHMKREAWVEAGGAFEQAMDCYVGHLADDRSGLAAMQARTDVDPGFRETQIRNFTLAVEDDERQRHAAAMNAATTFANAGDAAHAERLLAVAEQDPALADAVAAVKTFLAGRTAPDGRARAGGPPDPPAAPPHVE
jgi:tetratricopeptide (TPR) repeat protein